MRKKETEVFFIISWPYEYKHYIMYVYIIAFCKVTDNQRQRNIGILLLAGVSQESLSYLPAALGLARPQAT